MKGLISLSVLLFSLLSAPAFADYQKGWDAYESGNYEAAFAEWEPLAEQGDAYSQMGLGWMYSTASARN